MSRFHMRIALLSLGVVLGYGSAIARYYRGPSHAYGSFCRHGEEPQGPPARGQETPKPVH